MPFITNDFQLDLPDGWQDGSLITLIGPTSVDGFAANVVFTREDVSDKTSIEEFAAAQLSAVHAEIAGLEILDERALPLGGLPAFQRLRRFELEGRSLQQLQTFVLYLSKVFTITCTAEVAEFETHAAAFREIVNSFQLFERENSQP
jgi:hypothetical protein